MSISTPSSESVIGVLRDQYSPQAWTDGKAANEMPREHHAGANAGAKGGRMVSSLGFDMFMSMTTGVNLIGKIIALLMLLQLLSLQSAAAVTPTSPATHRWFPYRPIESAPQNPAQLTQIQVIDNGGFILTFSQDIDPICTAGTAGIPNGAKNRLYFIPDESQETGPAAVRAALATALAALHGGGQVHVMFNFTTNLCLGRFIAVTK